MATTFFSASKTGFSHTSTPKRRSCEKPGKNPQPRRIRLCHQQHSATRPVQPQTRAAPDLDVVRDKKTGPACAGPGGEKPTRLAGMFVLLCLASAAENHDHLGLVELTMSCSTQRSQLPSTCSLGERTDATMRVGLAYWPRAYCSFQNFG